MFKNLDRRTVLCLNFLGYCCYMTMQEAKSFDRTNFHTTWGICLTSLGIILMTSRSFVKHYSRFIPTFPINRKPHTLITRVSMDSAKHNQNEARKPSKSASGLRLSAYDDRSVTLLAKIGMVASPTAFPIWTTWR